MAAGFLVLLVLAWAVVCVSGASRARERQPLESTALFKRGLELLGPDLHPAFVRTYGRRLSVVPDPKPLVIRRGRTLLFLTALGAAVVTLAWVLFGGAWEVQLAADAALAIVVWWLMEDAHRRRVRRRQARRVRPPRDEGLRLAAGDG